MDAADRMVVRLTEGNFSVDLQDPDLGLEVRYSASEQMPAPTSTRWALSLASDSTTAPSGSTQASTGHTTWAPQGHTYVDPDRK